MKSFLLILFSVIFLTKAVEVTDEDINSPLVSYLLAKVQRLEALCEATGRGDKIMIPSHYVCPDGWHKEYNGYIMAGSNGHEGGSMYYCIDEALEQIQSSGTCDSVHYLYTVHSHENKNSGPYELPCVVCTK